MVKLLPLFALRKKFLAKERRFFFMFFDSLFFAIDFRILTEIAKTIVSLSLS